MAAVGNLRDQLGRAVHVVVLRRFGMAAVCGKDPQEQIGLRLAFVAEQDGTVVGQLNFRRRALVDEEQAA